MDVNMIHTDVGLALLAKLNREIPLKITRICAGTGRNSDLQTMTSMAGIKQQFEVLNKTQKDNQAVINIRLTNENLQQSYELTQVGIFANDPDLGEILYRIAQLNTGLPIMAEKDFPDYSLVSRITEVISNASDIEVTTDTTGMASKEDLTAHAQDTSLHFTNGEKALILTISNKAEKSDLVNYYTKSETDSAFAPKSHASSNSGAHGMATSSNYGHARATSTAPLMDGAAEVGSNDGNFARGNHRHPSDTSKANITDVLTKTNTAEYVPSSDYHPATKKYVDDKVSSGTTNYNDLTNKPKIGGIELSGNKTLSDLGIASSGHSHGASSITGGTFGGPVVAVASTGYTTAQVRNSIISTGTPSGGSNGDIWFQYY